MLLAAGACFFLQSGSFDKCALQPVECTSGQIFRSSGWLTTNNSDVSNQCSTQDAIRKLNSLGRCNGNADRYICTSDKTACRFQSVFSPVADDCDLVHDYMTSNEFSNSHFGFCEGQLGGTDFCAWSFQDCGGNSSVYEWNTADPFFANQNPDCHCDDVKTGACVDKGNNMFCAVAPEVCEGDEEFTYIQVLDLEFLLNTTCKLCDTLSAADLASDKGEDKDPGDKGEDKDPGDGGGSGATGGSDDGSPGSGTSNESQDGDGEILDESQNDDNKTLDSIGIGLEIIIIGFALGLSAMIVGVVFVVRRKRLDSEEVEDVGDDPSVRPPSII